MKCPVKIGDEEDGIFNEIISTQFDQQRKFLEREIWNVSLFVVAVSSFSLFPPEFLALNDQPIIVRT